MQATELSEIFGAPVLIQFRDSLVRAKPGEKAQYVPIDANSKPSFVLDPNARQYRPVGAERPRAIVYRSAEGESAGEPVFSYVLENATILPANGGRVAVCYESDNKLVTMYVRPDDIVAVSVVDDRPDERLIQKP